jgi:myosin heavy chain 6/7
MQNALEEGRSLLEGADRQRRSLEQELADTNETLADLSNTNQAITAAKRKLEVELNTLQADLDEMTNESRLSEDKAARAMVDAARLADELRSEQDVAQILERDRRLLEAQCKDSQARADEAEVNALKGGRKAMIKMETRIRELESELDAENRRFGDAQKNLRKSERRIKEMTFAADEDRKNHERMQVMYMDPSNYFLLVRLLKLVCVSYVCVTLRGSHTMGDGRIFLKTTAHLSLITAYQMSLSL